MTETRNAAMIEQRSELLATVVLTRRFNIDVHPFETGKDGGIDLIGTIQADSDELLQGFLPFGALVWGTSKELSNEQEANRFARSHKKPNTETAYFMPVIVLLFSMMKDEAYFAWLVKPCTETGKLLRQKNLDFHAFDLKQLDKMVRTIKKWYSRVSQELVAVAAESDSSQCPEDDD